MFVVALAVLGVAVLAISIWIDARQRRFRGPHYCDQLRAWAQTEVVVDGKPRQLAIRLPKVRELKAKKAKRLQIARKRQVS